ncbi:hypothetical protein DFH07DRAFT_966218 [Mycena maculata]|uniref:Uncharacterized protein n=1 Tax=Mycena maculata TaxID=230809 RepID=A0AAD7MY28_9AGAR|nr:hypothetical protein DFH07DRAFT_966218 [Mycena maculata]
MDLDIPGDLSNGPSVVGGVEAAGHLVAWHNDICSFNNVEQSHGDAQNLVYSRAATVIRLLLEWSFG